MAFNDNEGLNNNNNNNNNNQQSPTEDFISSGLTLWTIIWTISYELYKFFFLIVSLFSLFLVHEELS